MSHNNPPKLIPYIPIEPDADPILLYSYSLDSSDSFDSGYSKQGRCMRNKHCRNICKNEPIKIAPILNPRYLNMCTIPRSQGLNWIRIL